MSLGILVVVLAILLAFAALALIYASVLILIGGVMGVLIFAIMFIVSVILVLSIRQLSSA